MAKIALCYIVKAGDDSELEHLRASLLSVRNHVDGLFVNLNHKPGRKISKKVRQLCVENNAQIIETEWHDDFAEARNANFAQVPEDFTHILWLDTDDTIDKPQKVREVAEMAENYDAIFVDYLYDRDEYGNPTTVHMVARLLKNNGAHVWKGMIHETLIETRGVNQVMTKDFTVIHHADEKRQEQSTERNIRMLENQFEQELEDKNPDARTVYYLARAYADAGNYEAAKPMFHDFLSMSGWDQERSAAETRLGKIYQEEGNSSAAKEHFMLGIGEDPDNPEPRIAMGALEFELKQYGKAKHHLEDVLAMEKNLTTLERNPMNYTFRTYWVLSEVMLNMGGKHLNRALEYAKKALSFRKKDKDVKRYVKIIEGVISDRDMTAHVLELVKALKRNKEEDKIQELVKYVPKQIVDNPLIIRLREPEPTTWPKKSIAIWCGSGPIEEWGPWSLKEGIGGSEEAVIRLSKHLRDLGYKVAVYASPGINAGLHEGVMWRNHEECNFDDNFDIFIAWRAPFLFDRKFNARKAYLWLHDVMPEGEFTPERIANFDKCIVLSNYHRSLFPIIPDEKIMLSANGIDPDDFTTDVVDSRVAMTDNNPHQKRRADLRELIARDIHKMIYTSSHVRGLSYLYDIWPEVKKAVPDATLDVYYGRESYDAVHKGNPERIKWMDDMIAKAKALEGVTDHGKVGQDEIVRHIFESGLWVYPCPFPEISCITAMKMQAGGAVPVASNFAALNETIQYGHKQDFQEFSDEDLQKYKEALIWWLQHPAEQEKVRPEMMEWARKHYDWKNVAKQWSKEFED